MAKVKNTTIFYCQSCGHESSKWMGQCPGCKAWNSFVEETVTANLVSGKKTSAISSKEPSVLSSVSLTKEDRIQIGIDELDRVLGGGIVPGSLSLVGGDPGIGKSTLLLQVCQKLASQGRKVLYVSGEESLKQIKIRAMRIG